MDFLALSEQCGINVHPVTTMAIIKSESGFDPYVIRDNTTKKTYRFSMKSDAVIYLEELHKRKHKLAVGLMQITSFWFKEFRIDPVVLLDPCSNIKYGTDILSDNYQNYRKKAKSDTDALQYAISAYWSGSPHTGGAYVNYVYKKSGSPVRVKETPGVTDGILVSSDSNVR